MSPRRRAVLIQTQFIRHKATGPVIGRGSLADGDGLHDNRSGGLILARGHLHDLFHQVEVLRHLKTRRGGVAVCNHHREARSTTKAQQPFLPNYLAEDGMLGGRRGVKEVKEFVVHRVDEELRAARVGPPEDTGGKDGRERAVTRRFVSREIER